MIGCSETLKKIISEAEGLRQKAGNGYLCQEHVLLALLVHVRDAGGKEMVNMELKLALEQIPDAGDDNQMLIERMNSGIALLKNRDGRGESSFESVLDQAKISAMVNGHKEVTVDIVMRKIAQNASSSISRAYRQADLQSRNRENPKAPFPDLLQKQADRKKVQQDFDFDLFDDFFDKGSRVQGMLDPVKQLQQQLRKVVYGQDNAIASLVAGYFHAKSQEFSGNRGEKPMATFLFAGAPGVGKTFLAEQAAGALGLPFRRFDMSSFSDKEASLEFSGTDKVYRNAHEGLVTGFVRQNRRCVVLFDEIEKAHINIIHLFLQILDKAQLKDSFTGENVSFTNAIIIMTTNAGRELYENMDSQSGLISRKVILNALKNDVNPNTGIPYFPPAICSRFATGNVVMFNPLGPRDLVRIALSRMQEYADTFSRSNAIRVTFDERIATALLFAEGGKVDARALGSRADHFISEEVYNWLKFAYEKQPEKTTKLQSILIKLELAQSQKEAVELFVPERSAQVLLYSEDIHAYDHFPETQDLVLHRISDAESAKKLIETEDIDFVICDILSGAKRDALNMEDTPSAGRRLFETFRKEQLPFYVYCPKGSSINPEERQALLEQGAHDVFPYQSRIRTLFALKDIRSQIHCEAKLRALARVNKVLSFDCTYKWGTEENTGVITLRNLRISPAIDAEDRTEIAECTSVETTFGDIIGAEDAKGELMDFISYLKDPKSYARNRIPAPRGVMLYGPPGTGKTMLAKALAKESGATFIAAQGNQFLKDVTGSAAAEVKRLFAIGRKYAPSILFIDEIDIIGKNRMLGVTARAEEAVNALLNEMDGFSTNPNRPVFVLAATNFDVSYGSKSQLDPALLRRFDRRIYVDLPDKYDRVRFIRQRLEKSGKQLDSAVLENIAVRSTGMSLAELEAVVDFALRCMLRTGSDILTPQMLDEAFETYRFGEKTQWNKEVLRRVAVHESGHALVGYYSGKRVNYITVSGRSTFAGYMQEDGDESPIRTRKQLREHIRCYLAGRAAELEFLGDEEGVSTGAASDLRAATAVAMKMITIFGMDSSYGLASVEDGDNREAAIDLCNEILREEMEAARKLIADNREKVQHLVDILAEKNHLMGPAIESILKG